MKVTLTALLSMFLVSVASSFAFAAQSNELYAEAGAYIDYDYIDISFSGTGSLAGTSFLSTAGITGQSGSQDTLKAELESIEGTFYALGETDIADYDISAFAKVSGEDAYGYSQASAGYFGQYTAETVGTLTISIDYYFYSAVLAGTNQTVTSTASVLLDIAGEQILDALSFSAVNGEYYNDETDYKTLTLTFDLTAGQTVDFTVMALADTKASPVPIPGSALIMGFGLVGLVGIKRAVRA